MKKTFIAVISALIPLAASAQKTLTIEECRQMAIQNNKTLEQARTKVEMAGCDRKIALANYFPNVSATGAYMYNGSNISLVNEDMSAALRNMGTAVQGQVSNQMTNLMQAIMSNPAAAKEYMGSPMWQTMLGALSQTDLSAAINAIGAQVDDAFHLDIENVFAGAVSLQQPVFMGGKIIAANQIAKLAQELAQARYDTEFQQVIIDVDQAYWQIVSVAAKKELAESYADLLHKMERDVNISVREGVATEADALAVKVKANEADMLLSRSTSGLKLAKMLLCKQIGLDLESEIMLADEGREAIAMPAMGIRKDMDAIYADRPEIRSLDLASRIYEKKVTVARADMLPKVALTANYLVSNPNMQNGFQNTWGGMLTAGVIVNVPIFHGFEAYHKTRKAKAEATLYLTQCEDAKNMINLQVTQLRSQLDEALEKVGMAESNLSCAEENLRTAGVGFENGVIDANTALGAQTAWLKAHSEYIDAGIELQMTAANLQKAEGNYISE